MKIKAEPVKKLMKNTANIPVSHAGIYEVAKFLEAEVERITKLALHELEQENKLRELHNTPKLKRLSHELITKVLQNE